MLVSIVTLNFRKSELTIACMVSLYKVCKKEFENNTIELIIVDNASGDDSVNVLQQEIKEKHYKNIILIPNKTNSGFGAGCNVGAAKAKGSHIVFLNNDTVVKDKGILDMALYMEKHPQIAILGGQLRNFDGTLQPCAGKFYTLGNVILLLAGMQRYGLLDKSPEKIEEVDWVKGGLLMIRKDVFEKLHGFDEKIFMYTEDMELCYRAHLAGYKIYFYPRVTILHAEHGSSNRTFAIVNIYKNLLYFYKKHRSKTEYTILRFLLRSKAMTAIGIGKLSHNAYLVNTYQQAIGEI